MSDLNLSDFFDRHAKLVKILKTFERWNNPIHGHEHWMRVVLNGLMIAEHNPLVNRRVVELFGLLHDCKRVNDGTDVAHGARAAQFAKSIRPIIQLDDIPFQWLIHALAFHTHQKYHPNPTIGTCYDADRLDLSRVGIIPKAEFMNTEYAKKACKE